LKRLNRVHDDTVSYNYIIAWSSRSRCRSGSEYFRNGLTGQTFSPAAAAFAATTTRIRMLFVVFIDIVVFQIFVIFVPLFSSRNTCGKTCFTMSVLRRVHILCTCVLADRCRPKRISSGKRRTQDRDRNVVPAHDFRDVVTLRRTARELRVLSPRRFHSYATRAFRQRRTCFRWPPTCCTKQYTVQRFL